MTFEELPEVNILEEVVLEKFEGDVHPDNLIARLLIVDGAKVQEESIENGEVVKTDYFENGEVVRTAMGNSSQEGRDDLSL